MSEEFEYGFCSGSWWSPTTDLADAGVFGWDPKASTNSVVYQRPQESDSTLEFILPTCWNQVLNGQEDWSPENYSDNPLINLSTILAKKQPHNQLHLSNNTPFWNATADVPSQFLKENSYCNKTNTEPAFKRPRIQTLSPLPTFKVRKEKLGDRITALQQLVSPFGKTDTASVLTEAVEYINFLHEQLGILSTPCMMKNGALTHYQGKSDLSSRGLCLVPISIANETTADMWTPTFPGSYREEEFE